MRYTKAFADTFQNPDLVSQAMPRCFQDNMAHEDEILRVRIPTLLASHPNLQGSPSSRQLRSLGIAEWPPAPISFTDSGRGVPMNELILSHDHPHQLWHKMGAAYTRPGNTLPPAFNLLIRVRKTASAAHFLYMGADLCLSLWYW